MLSPTDIASKHRVVSELAPYETTNTTDTPTVRQTNLDIAVARRRNDVLLVEVHNVHRRPMSDQHATDADILRSDHVPNGYRSILQAGSSEVANVGKNAKTV